MSENPVKICFIHIPKTAGTSLRKMLRDNYHTHDVFNGNTMLDYEGKTKADLKNYKLFLGHLFYYRAIEVLPDNMSYITLLRHPIDRVISLYYFWRRHDEDYITNENIPEIIRRGPKLAKENTFLDFLSLEDPFIVQSISNNQLLQLLPVKKGHNYFINNKSAAQEIMSVINSFDVVGVQELFPFFVFKFNRRYRKHGIFMPKIEEKNKSTLSNNSEWNSLSQKEKSKIRALIVEKNKLEINVYNKIYNKNMREINAFFTNKLPHPQIYN